MIVTGIYHRCNFNCIFCLDKNIRNTSSPSLAELTSFFRKLEDCGEKVVMFMKGESLIRPDFIRVIQEARKFNLEVRVTTNGSMLSNYGFLENIIHYGITQINISFHSHLPKYANIIARNERCFSLQEKALHNIDYYNQKHRNSSKKVELFVNTVVCRLNYNHLNGLAEYLKSILKHTIFRIKFKLVERGSTSEAFYGNILPLLEEVQPYLLKTISTFGQKGLFRKFAFSGMPLCVTPSYEWGCVELQEKICHKNFYLNADTSFESKSIFDILNEKFSKYPECQDCSLFAICPGVKNEYRKAYPLFSLKLSDKNPESILKKLKLHGRKSVESR